MNDPKLKLAMARLLPEKMTTEHGIPGWKGVGDIVTDVLETEWLYVMQLVEQTLTAEQKHEYVCAVWYEICLQPSFRTGGSHLGDVVFATFNQRATAMCKVKGIEV